MPRVPMIERKADLAAGDQAVWDLIAEKRGRVLGPFPVLLHSPEVARRTAHLGAYLRFESQLPPTLRELAILAVAREMDCRFEWAAHARLAREAGVREEAIGAVRERRAPAGLTPEEAEPVLYVIQLVRSHRVDEALFSALRERLGVGGLVELTTTVGYYGMIAGVLNAFEVLPAAGEDALPV